MVEENLVDRYIRLTPEKTTQGIIGQPCQEGDSLQAKPSDIFSENNPSDTPVNKNLRHSIYDHILKNSPISFPQLVKDLDLKRTTAHDIVRDLEFARLITSFMKMDEYRRIVKWLRVAEGKK